MQATLPTMTGATMRFTNAQVDTLIANLPGCIDAHRRSLLPRVIKEWSLIDLSEHLTRPTPKQMRAERQKIGKIARRADDLAQALAGLLDRGRFAIAREVVAPGSDWLIDHLQYEAVREADRRFQEEPKRLKELSKAAKRAATRFVPLPFRHYTVIRYLVLLDLAAIYEWATRQPAGRRVRTDIDPGETYGPFWDFAGTAWPMIFGSRRGLDNALKTWASGRKRYGEVSPIIANLGMRHPEWRIHKTSPSHSAIGRD
jgi:hypothetical protein